MLGPEDDARPAVERLGFEVAIEFVVLALGLLKGKNPTNVIELT
jgi:hypothetical protein